MKKEDLIIVAEEVVDQLGINDLLKLRDYIELKIREIYEQDIQSNKEG